MDTPLEKLTEAICSHLATLPKEEQERRIKKAHEYLEKLDKPD